MKTYNYFISLLAILLFSLCSCSTAPLKEEYRSESTVEMANYLSSLSDSAQRDARSLYPYFTTAILRKYKRDLQYTPPQLVKDKELDYALLLLMKGDNSTCIERLEAFLNGREPVTKNNVRHYKILALAYLRQAEQTNCIDNHHPQSCIVPIQPGGVHRDSSAIAKAVLTYERLIDHDSTDLQSLWFLNIAYMAAGKYPNRVPEAYLISPDIFASDTAFLVFHDIAMQAGVATGNHAGGSNLEDFNNDGLLDIFTTGYSLEDQCRLYLNNGDATFRETTEESGLLGLTAGLNTVHADFDNNGLTDIFVGRGAWLQEFGRMPNSLLMNLGEGRFTDATRAAGLFSLLPTGTVAVADFNLDGHLDIFVGNESGAKKKPSALYVNNGDGTFTDMAPHLDMEINQFIKGANWGDIDNDGLPDLYLSVYGGRNLLFHNKGGHSRNSWEFEEIADSAGVAAPAYSFPTWFWDVNNDGWQDILVFGYNNARSYTIAQEVLKDYRGQTFDGDTPRLYLNNGDLTFTDATERMGLNALLYTMGANFGDLENDGYPDFYAGTGEFNLWAVVPNRMYRNHKGKYFQDITTAGGFGQIQKGHGVAFGDIDNDGDQDIYHQVGGAVESDVYPNMLFENPGFGNHWITLRLEGTTSNRSAIGAVIKVSLREGEKVRDIYHQVGTGGSFGANSLQAELGLGQAGSIREIQVQWPNAQRSKEVFKEVPMDRRYWIKEGKGELSPF